MVLTRDQTVFLTVLKLVLKTVLKFGTGTTRSSGPGPLWGGFYSSL